MKHPGQRLTRGFHGPSVEIGPMFVAVDSGYPMLLEQDGCELMELDDITPEYARTARRDLEASEDRRAALDALPGTADVTERLVWRRGRVDAIDAGLLCRERFTARPA